MVNINNKRFKVINNTKNGETSNQTTFLYQQDENLITAKYEGGKILYGQLIGLLNKNGNINIRYQQVNKEGILMTGKCISKPEILSNGKIRLHESWEWTSGNKTKGFSVVEEI
jgi:hypothetical protein